jgi:hypothetical protein
VHGQQTGNRGKPRSPLPSPLARPRHLSSVEESSHNRTATLLTIAGNNRSRLWLYAVTDRVSAVSARFEVRHPVDESRVLRVSHFSAAPPGRFPLFVEVEVVSHGPDLVQIRCARESPFGIYIITAFPSGWVHPVRSTLSGILAVLGLTPVSYAIATHGPSRRDRVVPIAVKLMAL